MVSGLIGKCEASTNGKEVVELIKKKQMKLESLMAKGSSHRFYRFALFTKKQQTNLYVDVGGGRKLSFLSNSDSIEPFKIERCVCSTIWSMKLYGNEIEKWTQTTLNNMKNVTLIGIRWKTSQRLKCQENSKKNP
jgi:hypothetical protein